MTIGGYPQFELDALFNPSKIRQVASKFVLRPNRERGETRRLGLLSHLGPFA